MAQLYATVAIGTAAAVLATILLLLRVKLHGHRPAMVLTRQWVATSTPASGFILASLAAIAIFCFAGIQRNDDLRSSGEAAPAHEAAIASSDGSDDGQAMASLRDYANTLDGDPRSATAATPAANATALPDVETLIAKLIARLEKQPNDANGWKMLGWSYLNTDKPDDAVNAYETALKLEPGNGDIEKALAQARAIQTASIQSPEPGSTPQPTTNDIKSAEGLSDTQRNDMIRGMVEKLAARLEASPNDENGWLRLMSSRVTLGEKDAAKDALKKALAALAVDSGAKGRLVAAARELGIETGDGP